MLRTPASFIALALVLQPTGAIGQVAPPDPDQAIKDRQASVQALADLTNAEANLRKAEAEKVKALGLPTFEGKTTLEGDKAGAMEVNLLVGAAIGAGAKLIGKQITDGDVLLAGDEVVDFDAAEAMKLQLKYIEQLYSRAGIRPGGKGVTGSNEKGGGGAGVVAAISTIAGLLRSETTISGVDATAVTDKALAMAVAASAVGKPIVPSAVVAGMSDEGKALLQSLNKLDELRDGANEALAALPPPDKASEEQKQLLKRLNAATTRHDAFLAKALSPAENGTIPFAVAVRSAGILTPAARVVRVYVLKAGGSIVNSRNIATTFGVDPLKVSGAAILAYQITQPKSGRVAGADLLSCDTELVGIRRVQERRWRAKRRQAVPSAPLCESVFAVGDALERSGEAVAKR